MTDTSLDFKKILPVVTALCFCIIGLSITFPLLPYMVGQHGNDVFFSAAIFSIFSFSSLLTAPLWGRLSDKMGRKPVLLMTVAGSSLALLWLYYCDTVIEIYINRFVAGALSGWIACAHAYIGDVTSNKNRIRGMAFIGIAFAVGFSIGPLIASLFVSDWQNNSDFAELPLMIGFFAYLIGGAIIILFMSGKGKKSPHPSDMSDIYDNRQKLLHIMQDNKKIPLCLLALLFFQIPFTGLESTLALWAFSNFSAGPETVGLFLAFAGITALFVHGGVASGLSKTVHETILLLAGASVLFCAIISLQWVNSIAMAYGSMFLLAVGSSLFMASASSFLSKCTGDNKRGRVMGLFQATNNLSRILGPLFGGLLFSFLGSGDTYLLLPIPLFITIAVLFILRRKDS